MVVVEGPLMGRETWIMQVNRRKGVARIEAEPFGRRLSVEVGLVVLRERPAEVLEVAE